MSKFEQVRLVQSRLRPTFTIATPTYNRADSLVLLLSSLIVQSVTPLEWIVIDDGSTDRTATVMYRLKQLRLNFHIQYHYQPNQGPHIALNRAARLARGDWFVYVPSDDYLLPDALETFQELILGLSSERWTFGTYVGDRIEPMFCAVGGRCMRPDGTIPGKEFPRDPIDFNYAEGYFRWPYEKQAAIRTSILKRYPFPAWSKQYVPEGISWARMGLRYRQRFTNRPVRVFQPSIQKKEGSSLATRPAARGRLWFHTIMLIAGLKYWWHPRYLMMFPAIAKDLVKLYFFTLRNALSH